MSLKLEEISNVITIKINKFLCYSLDLVSNQAKLLLLVLIRLVDKISLFVL